MINSLGILIGTLLFVTSTDVLPIDTLNLKVSEQVKEVVSKEIIEDEKNEKSVTLSFAGDVVLGIYYGQLRGNRFDEVYKKEGNAYFFENVYPIFSEDDLTVVNLEGTFTDVGTRVDKRFPIKGELQYVNILAEGAIEVVSLANNHTYDYGKEGYEKTKQVLKEKGIGYFGERITYYANINKIKIALIGAKGWNNSASAKSRLKKRIESANSKADLVIIMFHWGEEKAFYPNATQIDLAHFVVDQGVDLVLGAHPHVMQGIEKYKGKNIVYSLGNFSFGANKNPKDKDTFIYQETFELTEDGIESVETKVIPCWISSVTERNDYKPTLLQGKAAKKVMNRLKTYSKIFNESYFEQ